MKISELNLAGAIAGTEVFPIVQGGETKKVSIADALAGAGGVPTLQQVTDVANGNKTTTDIYNYFDIANNYVKLTNDIDGGGSQTPGLEIQKINSNGLSRVLLNVHNNNPSVDDYQDSYIYFLTNPTIGLANQVQLGSNVNIGELTQQLRFQVNTIGSFSLLWNYPSQTPKINYNDINSGNSISLEFSNSLIKTTSNNNEKGFKINFDTNNYQFGNGLDYGTLICENDKAFFTRGLLMQLDDINVKIGDYNTSGNSTLLEVDDFNKIIKTTTRGNETGFKLDFFNNESFLGNYTVLDNVVKVSNGLVEVYSTSQIFVSSGNSGLSTNASNSQTLIGDVVNNNTLFGVDDNQQSLIASGNLISTQANPTFDRLKIKIGGTDYLIVLEQA
jgi:hypothetical protein